VTIPFRSDLQRFLVEFMEQHRGTRLGKMFGLPAGYVGRKLFTCLVEDGIIVRLPEEVARREIRSKQGAPYSRRGHAMGAWVMYRPRHAIHLRHLAPMLELAARHVAERQTEDITGVKLPRSRRHS
jgi:hypothetical protein